MGNCPGAVWGVVGDVGGPPPRKRRLTILLNAVSLLNASYMRARHCPYSPLHIPSGIFLRIYHESILRTSSRETSSALQSPRLRNLVISLVCSAASVPTVFEVRQGQVPLLVFEVVTL